MTDAHWDELFATRPDTGFGWYEAVPSTLADVLAVASPDDAVIDVGAGTSTLVDELAARGWRDLTVLDISAEALSRTRARMAATRPEVDLGAIVADVTDPGLPFERTWDLWHDRAVFHFLVAESARAGYKAALRRALAPGGRAIIATFAADGPGSCAGLPVQRYDETTLAAEFADVMECEGCRTKPVTAADTDRRPYTICRFRRR